MEESDICKFLSPLTLEAQVFLNSLNKLSEHKFPLDSNLFGVLINIINRIDGYLKNTIGIVRETPRTKLVEPDVVNNLQRIYHCGTCKRDLGKTTVQAVKHIVECHTGREHVVDIKKNDKPDGRAVAVNPLEKKKVLKRKTDKEKRAKAIMKIPKKLVALFNVDLTNFFKENIPIAEKLKTMPQYEKIEQDLMKTLQPLFPNSTIRLYKFGSRITGIATRNSDLDIFVDINNVSHIFENGASDMTLEKIKIVQKGLRNDKKAWTCVLAIKNARVPILKVRNVATNIELDIGFSNSLGFYNSKLIEYLFTLQPLARRICVYMKKWLDFSKLSEYYPTYSVILMVVFFFQLRKYLPNMTELQSDETKAIRVGPWIGSFEEKNILALGIKKLDVNTEQCKIFLHDFFEFYGNFDFSKHIVCPLYGRLVEIGNFNNEMPKRYTKFVKQHADERYCEIDLSNRAIVVQDPIQLNHNITKRVSMMHLNALVDFFKKSAEAFKKFNDL